MKADVVIVGAGFAGASTAFHLSRRFGGAIVVVDKEALPGFHASGRNAVPARAWSCFRTRTPDDRFLIGWDPRLENFFWVAGLGGHGMAASWEVGRLAAERFSQRGEAGRSPFDPARFR